MNYKCFLRQQLCILVRGADGGRESMSCLLIMVLSRFYCFRGFRGVVSYYGQRFPCLLVYGFLNFRPKVTLFCRHNKALKPKKCKFCKFYNLFVNSESLSTYHWGLAPVIVTTVPDHFRRVIRGSGVTVTDEIDFFSKDFVKNMLD